MKDLTFTQEYLLCALNPKGSIPLMDSNRIITCMVAGGLLELLNAKAVAVEAKKKVAVLRKLNEDEKHLEPLYDALNTAKPMTVNDIASKYVFSTSKRINEFMRSLSLPMQAEGLVSAGTGGLFRNKPLFIPDPKAVSGVIEKIRAEFLEDGPIQDETVVLGALLQKSGLIGNYFSKYESDRLKKRLDEVKKSEAGSLVKEMIDYIDLMFIAIAVSSASSV
jgi:hypothetical protein